MTAYEAMLKSKEDAAGIMTSFLVMVLEGLFKKEISNISKKEIAMLVREVMDCEVEEVE
nr:MAG TPA: Colicin immunity protein / pyocin immunity protein [Caudoviricetes sp.]